MIILALPGSAVAGLAADHGSALSGRLVIDATNQLGAAVANARAELGRRRRALPPVDRAGRHPGPGPPGWPFAFSRAERGCLP